MKKYQKIYSGSSIIIMSIKNCLNDINIIPIIKDQSESARLAGFGYSINLFQDVFVHDDEYSKAIYTLKKENIL